MKITMTMQIFNRAFASAALAAVMLCTLEACGSSPAKPAPALAAAPSTSSAAAPTTPAVLPKAAVEKFDHAISLLESGQLDAAEQQLTELTTAYPDFSGPYLNLGITQMKRGDFPAAEKSLQTAAARAPQNAKVFNQLGILYRHLGRLKEADTAYQEALRLDPDYALAHLNLGVLCDLYLGQPERALGEYERYLSLTSEPQPQVAGWVKELRARLGMPAPAPAAVPAPAGDVKPDEPPAKAAT